MKKLLAVLLSTITLLTMLASCKGDDAKKTDAPENKNEKITVASTEELIEKRVENTKNAKELSADMSMEFAMTGAGMDVDMYADATVKFDYNGKKMYIDFEATAMGDTVDGEMYMDFGETGAMYLYSEDTWMKMPLDEASLAQLNTAYNLENEYNDADFIVNATHTEEQYNGVDCYKLTYNFDFEKVMEVTGMNMKEMLGEDYDEMTEAVMLMIFENMGNVPVTEYIDVTTLCPIAMEMDMTDALGEIVANVIDMVIEMQYGEGLSAADLGITFDINKATIKCGNMSFEDVTITIPEEALAAEEV